MRRSRESLESEGCCICCFAPVFGVMGLTVYGIICAFSSMDILGDRMDRLEEKYSDAVNVTMSYSSTCEGSLGSFYDRADCPDYDPCDDYCQKYFDTMYKANGSVWGLIGLAFVLTGVIAILFFDIFLNCIGNTRNIVNNWAGMLDRAFIHVPLNNAETTSLNSTSRFRKDQSRFSERQDGSSSSLQSPYNENGLCPITQEKVSNLKDPVVASDNNVYSHTDIKKWLRLKGASPVTMEAMDDRLIPYNHQQSVVTQQQIVSMPNPLSSLTNVTFIGSGRENESVRNNETEENTLSMI